MSAIIPVGIDLGTTLSAVSYVNSDGATEMIRDADGNTLTPSAVLFEENAIHVGAKAWAAGISDHDRVAENAKRDIGARRFHKTILGQEYPPEVIQSCILRQLQRNIIASVGENYRVVITVPAYFDEARRKITADAATMSGLPVLDIVNEPTAAALAFGERLGYLTPEGAPNERMRLAVYDLGGGTFDVTVMELSPHQVRTLSSGGDYELGGNNWDERIADFAEQRFRTKWPEHGPFDASDRIRLLRAAQTAKHALSAAPLTMVSVDSGGKTLQVPIRRDEFEDISEDLLARTKFTTTQVLREAHLLWDDVDRLLLVGGATRMPAVRLAMHELTGLVPDDGVHPEEAVARGAAIFARFRMAADGVDPCVPTLQVTDVNAHGLGIEGVNQGTLRVENVTLIPRNTPLPFEVKRTFVTKADDQRSVKVRLLEGDSSLPAHCSPLAVAAIRHLPPGLPKGTPIKVTYRFEGNGRLSVSANVVGLGEEANIELERVRGLTDERVKKWRQIVCRDGGFKDFEEGLAMLLLGDGLDATAAHPIKHSPEGAKSNASLRQSDLSPAIHRGAPLAASDHLNQKLHPTSQQPQVTSTPERSEPPTPRQQVRRRTPREPRRLPTIFILLGHVIAGFMGMALGYYALCWVRPDLNFLDLELPGIQSEGEHAS